MTQVTVDLPSETAARLEEEARARGLTLEALASEALQAWAADEDLDWEEDLRRIEEPGEDVGVREAFARFDAEVAEEQARLKSKK